MPEPASISAGPWRSYELANCVLMLAAKLGFIIFLHLLVVLCSSLGVVDRCVLCRILQFENLLLLGIGKMVVHNAGTSEYFRWPVTFVWVGKLCSHAGCKAWIHHISSSPGLFKQLLLRSWQVVQLAQCQNASCIHGNVAWSMGWFQPRIWIERHPIGKLGGSAWSLEQWIGFARRHSLACIHMDGRKRVLGRRVGHPYVCAFGRCGFSCGGS